MPPPTYTTQDQITKSHQHRTAANPRRCPSQHIETTISPTTPKHDTSPDNDKSHHQQQVPPAHRPMQQETPTNLAQYARKGHLPPRNSHRPAPPSYPHNSVQAFIPHTTTRTSASDAQNIQRRPVLCDLSQVVAHVSIVVPHATSKLYPKAPKPGAEHQTSPRVIGLAGRALEAGGSMGFANDVEDRIDEMK